VGFSFKDDLIIRICFIDPVLDNWMNRMNLKPLPTLFAITVSVLVTNAYARDLQHTNESSLQISRYVNILPGPTEAQRNPLHMVLPNVLFNHNIKSVGQAIQFLLKDTGYKLTRHHPDKRVHQMFRLSLPKIHRRMGPLTLEQALKTLSGEPWVLSVDPINRLISFQLPDHFKKPTHMSANPALKKVAVKTPTKKWDKSNVKQLQRQYRHALKPIRKPVRRKPKVTHKVTQKPIAKKTVPAPTVKKFDLMSITWADLPKELR